MYRQLGNYFIYILLLFVLLFQGCKTMVTCDSCNGVGKIICQICDGEKDYEIKEDCSYCSNGNTLCEECGGNGNLECQQCNGEGMKLEPCQFCGGSGMYFYPDGNGVSCRFCSGAAMIMQPCHSCGGEGNRECDECNGDGSIVCKGCNGKMYEIKTENCNLCDENGKVVCNKCKGEGKVEKKWICSVFPIRKILVYSFLLKVFIYFKVSISCNTW